MYKSERETAKMLAKLRRYELPWPPPHQLFLEVSEVFEKPGDPEEPEQLEELEELERMKELFDCKVLRRVSEESTPRSFSKPPPPLVPSRVPSRVPSTGLELELEPESKDSDGTLVLTNSEQAPVPRMAQLTQLLMAKEKLDSLDIAFGPNQHAAASKPSFEIVPPAQRKYDFFINHCQQSGGDQCRILALLLRAAGASVWYDMDAHDLTATGMEEGVANSRNVIVFLSQGVMSREWCNAEQRWAKQYKCKLIGVMECDKRHNAVDIQNERDTAPDDLKHLLVDIEFVPFRRRNFEEATMVGELMRRGGAIRVHHDIDCQQDNTAIIALRQKVKDLEKELKKKDNVLQKLRARLKPVHRVIKPAHRVIKPPSTGRTAGIAARMRTRSLAVASSLNVKLAPQV
jgi:hypothetical protein